MFDEVFHASWLLNSICMKFNGSISFKKSYVSLNSVKWLIVHENVG